MKKRIYINASFDAFAFFLKTITEEQSYDHTPLYEDKESTISWRLGMAQRSDKNRNRIFIPIIKTSGNTPKHEDEERLRFDRQRSSTDTQQDIVPDCYPPPEGGVELLVATLIYYHWLLGEIGKWHKETTEACHWYADNLRTDIIKISNEAGVLLPVDWQIITASQGGQTTDALPEKQEGANSETLTVSDKRGGKYNFNEQRRLDAVIGWATVKGSMKLEEYLDDKFGNKANVANVQPSTFYGWRRRFISEGRIKVSRPR